LLGHLQHILIALLITFIGWCVGYVDIGIAVAVTAFVVRELTQAEYRYIDRFLGGVRANMPWYASVLPVVWDVHSVLGFALPTVVSLALGLSLHTWC
jgi:hypothetical protein